MLCLNVLLNLGITFFHNFNLILRSFFYFLKMKHFLSCDCDLNIFFLKFLFLEGLLFLWDINLDIFTGTVYSVIFIKKAKLNLIFRQDIPVFNFFSTEYLYINYLRIRWICFHIFCEFYFLSHYENNFILNQGAITYQMRFDKKVHFFPHSFCFNV